jgi:hypothetical protein
LDNTIPKRIGYLEIKLRQFAAFLVTFFAVEKSDWHVGPLPTVLIENSKKKVNPENIPSLLRFTTQDSMLKTLASSSTLLTLKLKKNQ